MWVDETRIDSFKPIAAEFEAETGVKVELVQKISGEIKDDFIAQVPTGEGPDVIIGAHDWTGSFVTNGVVAPIELGDKAGDFAESAITAFAYDGQQYGMPYAIENIALIRNNALARRHARHDFDELVAQAKGAGTEFSVIIQQGPRGDAYHLYPLQTSFGAPVFSRPRTAPTHRRSASAAPRVTRSPAYLQKLGQEKVLDPRSTATRPSRRSSTARPRTPSPARGTPRRSPRPAWTSPSSPSRPPVARSPRSRSSASRAPSSPRSRRTPSLANEFVDELPHHREDPGRAVRVRRSPPGPDRLGREGRRPDPPGLRRGRRDRCADALHPRDGLGLGASGAPPRSRSSTARRLTRPAAWNTMMTNIQGAIDAS